MKPIPYAKFQEKYANEFIASTVRMKNIENIGSGLNNQQNYIDN